MKRGWSPCPRSGFTLMEILAAISLLAVISTIALPNAESFFASQKVGSEAKTFLADLRLGRFEALRTGQTHRLVLTDLPTQNRYRVEQLEFGPEDFPFPADWLNDSHWRSVLDDSFRELDPGLTISINDTSTLFFTPEGKIVESWEYGQEGVAILPRTVTFAHPNATMAVTITSYGGFSSREYYEAE